MIQLARDSLISLRPQLYITLCQDHPGSRLTISPTPVATYPMTATVVTIAADAVLADQTSGTVTHS